MIKKLVLVAVSAMLVLNVSAREVRKGKGQCKQFKKEQRVIILRQGRPMPREIRFKQAMRMKRFEDARKMQRVEVRKAPPRHHRHHGRR